MTDGTGSIEQESPDAAGTPPTWYARKPADVVAALDSDLEHGLSRAEAAARLSRYGPNRIAEEKPPSVWAIALNQLREPMNIMLVAVVVVSLAHRRGLDGPHRRPAHRPQRGARHPPGADRPGQRGRPVEDAGAAGPGGPGRRARARPGGRPGARRRRAPRGRRPRAGRRAHPAVGHAGDPGGGADRGERAGGQGRRRRCPPGTSPSATAPTWLFQNTSVTRGTATIVDHRDRDEHPDGPDRDDADRGDPHPVAAAARARLADQGARHHRLDRGRLHRRRGRAARPAVRSAPAARHRDGHLGHPDRHAGLRLRAALGRRQAPGRRPRPWSRTSPTSRRSARPARSTPTRPAP